MIVGIFTTLMVHPDGKFYQVFSIGSNSGSVLLAHWGKGSPSKAVEVRPVTRGKSKIFHDVTYPQKIDAKLKRGYITQDVERLSFNCGDSFDSSEDRTLIKYFGSTQAREIFTQLLGNRAESLPTVAQDNEVMPGAAPIIEDRPQFWGSW